MGQLPTDVNPAATKREANCRTVFKDPPNAVLPCHDLFWYGYRPAKPLPPGVRQCRALADHVDWRFLAVFPAPGAVRGAYLTYFVLEPPQVTVPRYQFHYLSDLPPTEGEQFPAPSFTRFSPQGLGFAATLSRKPRHLA